MPDSDVSGQPILIRTFFGPTVGWKNVPEEDVTGETFVTPEQYGADGTPAADTAAIRDAVNSGFPIHFQARTYFLDTTVDQHQATVYVSTDHPQQWIGAGPNMTIIRCTGTNPNDPIQFWQMGSAGIYIKDIQFDGAGALTASSGFFPNLHPIIYIAECSHVIIDNCWFLGWSNSGLLFNEGEFFTIRNCFFSRLGGVPASTSNGALHIAGSSRYGLIDNNTCWFGGIQISCAWTSITNNRVTQWGFSAGINSQALSSNHDLYIAGNHCYSSANVPDASPYYMGGIENWARDSQIIGNMCNSNCGNGIDNGGANCIIQGNICYDNGSGGQPDQSGIFLLRQDATNNADGSYVSGNLCFDTRVGGARTQAHGYTEHAPAGFTEVKLGQNWFRNHSGGNLLLPSNSLTYDPRDLPLSTPIPATKTGNYTQVITDSSLIFNNVGGTTTVTLLNPTFFPGMWLTIKNIANQAVNSAGSVVVPLLGGAPGTALLPATAGKWVDLQSDGTNWIIMRSN